MNLTTMKSYFGSLRYLLLLLAMPLAASTTRIYVTNRAGSTVSVIDPVTNKVVMTIEGIEAPDSVDISPDGSRAYITDDFFHTVVVVDTRTGNIIKRVPLTGLANDLVVTKDGRRVLVCIRENPPTAAVEIIDTASLERIKTLPMRGYMHDINLTEDGKYAIAGSEGGHFFSVIDLKTEQPLWEVNFETGVHPIAVESNTDGSARRIFVQLEKDLYGFVAVDFARRQEVARIKLPAEPSGFGPKEVIHGIGISPDNKSLLVNSDWANSVFVYSLPDLKLLGHVPLPELRLPGKPPIGASPHWITFTPDSKTAYVANSHRKSVSVIDVKTMKAVAEIPVGEQPNHINSAVFMEAPPAGPSVAQSSSASAQSLDYDFFVTRVEPFFLKKRAGHARCYACHANTGRGGPGTPAYLERVLPGNAFWTDEQSRRNFQRVSQWVVPGKPESSVLLMHPLAPEAGGDAVHMHGGGRQFESQNDPDWQTLADWVRGAKANLSFGP